MSDQPEVWPTSGKVWASNDLVIGYSAPVGQLAIQTQSPVDAITLFQGPCKVKTAYAGERPKSVEFDSGDITFTETGADLVTSTEHFPSILFISSPTGYHKKLVDQISDGSQLQDTSTRGQKPGHRIELSRMLMQFLDTDGFGGQLKAEALSCLIVSELLQSSDGKALVKPKGGLGHNKIKLVREYIHEHCDEDLKLDLLAELVGVSSFHFARMFKHDTGLSPHQYVIHSRVTYARELLINNKASISDVAYQAGFSSQSHMTASFQRVIGTTPARYRQIALS